MSTASLQPESVAPASGRSDPWIVTTLVSFETVFVLFLMAGRYKADPRFDWIAEYTSVDITALFFAATGLAGLIVVLGKQYRIASAAPAALLAAAGFFGWALLSMLWTSGTAYAQTKALHVGALVTGTFLVCAAIIASRRYRVTRLLLIMVVFCVWLSVESLLTWHRSSTGRSVMALGGNYLGLGRMIGPAALISLAYGLFIASAGMGRAVGLGLFAFFSGVLLVLGGRMPLVATAAGALVPLAIALAVQPRHARRWARGTYLLLLVAAVVTLGYLLTSHDAPQTLRRMTLLLDGSLGSSAQGRIECYQAAARFWWERPVFGHGLGSWPMLYLQTDLRAHPHNIIFELLVELGLVGLLLFGSLLVLAWRSLGSLRQIAADPLRIIILMLLVNALANAMVSGDLSDNRFLFGMLGLACVPRLQRNKP